MTYDARPSPRRAGSGPYLRIESEREKVFNLPCDISGQKMGHALEAKQREGRAFQTPVFSHLVRKELVWNLERLIRALRVPTIKIVCSRDPGSSRPSVTIGRDVQEDESGEDEQASRRQVLARA